MLRINNDREFSTLAESPDLKILVNFQTWKKHFRFINRLKTNIKGVVRSKRQSANTTTVLNQVQKNMMSYFFCNTVQYMRIFKRNDLK